MSERDSDFGAFLAGFAVGGVIGAIAALLLAPQSGAETRTMIHDRSIELKDKAVEQAEAARIKAEAAAADARAKADEIAKLTQDKAVELKKKGQGFYQSQISKTGSSDQNKTAASTDDSSEVVVEG